MASLTGSTIASTYLPLLRITNNTMGEGGTAYYIKDSVDTNSALSISTTSVGIGTDAPDDILEVSFSDTTAISDDNIDGGSVSGIHITNTANSSGYGTVLKFSSNTDNAVSAIAHKQTGTGDGDLLFFTMASDDLEQRMVIKDAGNVGIGMSAPSERLHIGTNALGVNEWLKVTANTNAIAGIQLSADNVAQWWIYNNASDVLYITDAGNDDGLTLAQSGSGAGVSTLTSDERAKDILEPISNALNKVNTLRAVNFKWKYGNEERRTRNNFGLIAQDVLKIAPEACIVPEGDFEVIDHPIYEGEKQCKNQMTYSNSALVPVLVKAIQELSAKVTALENA